MENVYAALLLHKLGKAIDEASIQKIIEAAGGKVEDSKIKTLLASLSGVDIAKELENAAVAVAPVGNAPVAEKKEENKEVKTEAAAEGLSALFG